MVGMIRKYCFWIGKDKLLWEEEVFKFARLHQLRAVTPYLPRGECRLDPHIYEMVLFEFLKTDAPVSKPLFSVCSLSKHGQCLFLSSCLFLQDSWKSYLDVLEKPLWFFLRILKTDHHTLSRRFFSWVVCYRIRFFFQKKFLKKEV